MRKINVVNYMNNDAYVLDFLTKHVLVNLVKREKLPYVSREISDYFYNLVDIVDFNLDTKNSYIVIKYVDKFYRLSGIHDGTKTEFKSWVEVRITNVEIKYTWGIL